MFKRETKSLGRLLLSFNAYKNDLNEPNKDDETAKQGVKVIQAMSFMHIQFILANLLKLDYLTQKYLTLNSFPRTFQYLIYVDTIREKQSHAKNDAVSQAL